ncbi:MAG TPA: substrate-binding domain-containing protein [Fibrobacteraceae bacterium]|jgi:phosphate transport system substrate-binding protein|nr:substrate-binding domain-containing protein [Fibrobacteraceae bacterium]
MNTQLKKLITISLGLALVSLFVACDGQNKKVESKKEGAAFESKREIFVVTREQGSGTRDAFVELTGILVKVDGKKKDNTSKEALTIDGTQAVMSNIAGNEYAIGYISLGSLNSSVKAISVNGNPISAETVKNGTYPISRPFNIATKGTVSAVAEDFIAFILSDEGQAVVEKNGYIAVQSGTKYAGKKPSGKIVIAGSSSVSPVMEKLKEAYLAINSNAQIEIQTNDSSAGMVAAKEGTCDIGMASRALKDSEKEVLQSTVIAMDGIAVIVNNKNPLKSLSMSQIREVFTGFIRNWEAVIE